MSNPTQNCPYCGEECEADWVDVGVGYIQSSPYHCLNCFASQIGPYDKSRELTEEEERTGWYAPSSDPGSSANVIGGRIVSHQEMRETYRDAHFAGEFDDEWWDQIRKKSVPAFFDCGECGARRGEPHRSTCRYQINRDETRKL